LDFAVELLDDMLGDVQDQMDSLLWYDSAYECKHWNAVIKVSEMEVLLLQHLFGCHVIWSSCVQFLQSFGDWNTVGVGEWSRFGPEEIGEGRGVEEVFSVGVADCCPLV